MVNFAYVICCHLLFDIVISDMIIECKGLEFHFILFHFISFHFTYIKRFALQLS